MDAAQFFRALFDLEEGETINIRTLHARSGRPGKQGFLATVEEAVAFVASMPSDMEIYFGVNPRVGRDGTKAGVSWCQLLHADVDSKRYASRDDTFNAIVAFELEPTIVVDSGNGFHVYWLLSEALPPEEFDRAETMMRRIHLAFGGLDATQDVSRILRVPGTWNNKDPRNPKKVRVVFQQVQNRYCLCDFDQQLPGLPAQIDHREVTEVVADHERPSLELLAELLRHINPCLPQDQYFLIWAAVAYYYPDEDGLRLVDEWSSEARANNGQSCSPRTDPGKHWRYKRQTGRVSTLGTLIYHAKQGGYVPPARQNLIVRAKSGNLVSNLRKHREAQLTSKLSDIVNPTYDDLPHYVKLFYDYLGPLAEPFPRDYSTFMILGFLSILWPKVRFENLNMAVWVVSSVESGSGKNKVTDALYNVIERTTAVPTELYTSGTAEGMYRVLRDEDGQGGRVMFAYLREYGHFLASLKREHMAGARGVLCNLYDGANIHHRLARTEVIVTEPYVVLIGTTTPRAIVDNLTRDDLEGGFASRCWLLANDYVNEDNNHHPSEAAQKELAALLDQHVADHAHVRVARFDVPEGSVPQAYLDYCASVGIGTGEVRTFADALNDPKSPMGRHAARIKKVAAGLELAELIPQVQDGVLVVREKNLLLAIALIRRGMVYQEIVYSNISSTDEERWMNSIQRVLDKAGPDGLTRAQLMQNAHVKARDLKELLGAMEEAGLVVGTDDDDGAFRYRAVPPVARPGRAE